MTYEEMKAYIKEQGKEKRVKELVVGGGYEVEIAVEYVYDALTMTREQFIEKYI